MPFQNTGTLLENIVLIEAARGLFDRTNGVVEWASAFSMPPLTVWRRAEQYEADSPLFTIERLNAIAAAKPSEPDSYQAFLHQCLQHNRMLGPNGIVLVGLLAQYRRRSLRAWVEDVPMPAGHYGPARAPLEALGTYVAALGVYSHSPFAALDVSTTKYPDCLCDLRDALSRWQSSEPPSARLGYLDPNVYRPEGRTGPQTASADHCRWLRTLASEAVPWAITVHFSSNRDRAALRDSLACMHADGDAAGYDTSTSYQHLAHSTTVLVQGPSPEAAAQYAQWLHARVQAAWNTWRDGTPQPSTDLHIASNLHDA